MPKSTPLLNRIQSTAARLTFRFFQFLPFPVGSAIGAGIGHLYAAYGDWRGQLWFKRLQRNLSVVSGETKKHRLRRMAYQQVRNSGRVTAEFPAIDPIRHSHRLNIVGLEHAEHLDGPVIIVGAHVANWETTGASLVLRGIPITALYLPPANETVHCLAVESRQRLLQTAPGSKLLAASGDAIKKLLRAAWQRENLLIFVDEAKDGLIWSPPLGRKLPDHGNRMLVALLALKCGYQVLPVHVKRKRGAWFDLIIEPPLTIQQSGDETADMKRLGDEIADVTERWVRESPEQWYWMPDLNLDRPFPEKFR